MPKIGKNAKFYGRASHPFCRNLTDGRTNGRNFRRISAKVTEFTEAEDDGGARDATEKCHVGFHNGFAIKLHK